HVFRMYIPFQDATFLPVSFEKAPVYELGEYSVPAVSETAARGEDGRLYASLANLHPGEAADVTLAIEGADLRVVSAEVLTAPKIDSHNTFTAPDQVRPWPFDGAAVRDAALRVELPAKSIVMIALE